MPQRREPALRDDAPPNRRIREAAFAIMEDAYRKASANGQCPPRRDRSCTPPAATSSGT